MADTSGSDALDHDLDTNLVSEKTPENATVAETTAEKEGDKMMVIGEGGVEVIDRVNFIDDMEVSETEVTVEDDGNYESEGFKCKCNLSVMVFWAIWSFERFYMLGLYKCNLSIMVFWVMQSF
jgi:hypothetical protein